MEGKSVARREAVPTVALTGQEGAVILYIIIQRVVIIHYALSLVHMVPLLYAVVYSREVIYNLPPHHDPIPNYADPSLRYF
jgi:hypothetical protein